MPKIKPKRAVPSIDMTAMVDVAFLLLTFFILTTKFKAEEKVAVDLPSSISGSVVTPEIQEKAFLITISKEGDVYVGHFNPDTRESMLQQIMRRYNFSIPQEGFDFFRNSASFAVPITQFPQWLNQDPAKMAKFPQTSIPIDLRKGKVNELKEWVLAARIADPYTVFVIKGDRTTNYPEINKVISTLQDAKVNKFNLVTSIESDPDAPKEAPADSE